MKVWLNGRIVATDDAKVSAFDAGFQHGVGLFETLRVTGGEPLDLEKHLARLAGSAADLRLSTSMDVEPLGGAIRATLEANELTEARVRITLSGGDLNMLSVPGERHDPTLLIVAQPPTIYPKELFETGVMISVAEGRLSRADRFAGHKTLWYWPRLFELQRAAAVGAAESVWFTTRNILASGCVSNVFMVEGKTLVTPPARGEALEGQPVLPGIVRSWVFEKSESAGQKVERSEIDINRLLAANEVFLTNSSWGVMPVVKLEDSTIGAGVPGPVAAGLINAWTERLAGLG